ncbi:hypothetical protein ACE3MZ_13575 [Paenibacillus sp. WLX1005]|uniref:hypothetical protein n=1 Tax=Paenibacillus sp. WLX1005 TaxID=3243766 RepID=UPI003983E206
MMQKFDMRQINNFINGNALATELKATQSSRRAFVVIGPTISMKFLNTTSIEQLIFWIRKYEIQKVYIENDWDVSDDELLGSIHIKNIKGINQLEKRLSTFLDDFSKLDVEWKTENPL